MRSAKDEFIHYWPLVLASFVGIMLGGSAMLFFTLGPLVNPLQAEFGWSPSQVLRTLSYMGIGGVIGFPLVGRLCDRFDLRSLAIVSTIFLAVLLLAVSAHGGRLWYFNGLYFAMGLVTSGTGGVIYLRTLGQFFEKGRGLAFGIALCGAGGASFVAPLFVHVVYDAAGWREVYIGLAGVIVLVALPIIWFGMAAVHSRGIAKSDGASDGFAIGGTTRRQAMRDVRFYLLVVALVLFGLFVGSLVVNLVPMLAERDFDAGTAARIASLVGIALMVGRLLIGWLLDRTRPSFVGAGAFALTSFGLCMFVFMPSGLLPALIAAMTIGLIIGAELDLLSYMAMRYFGLRHYGEILGLLTGIYAGSGIVGPLVGSALVDRGGFELLFLIAASACALVAITFIILSFFEGDDAGC